MTTPTRRGLVAESSLQPRIEDGLQALKREHRRMIAPDVRSAFADSVDVDLAFKAGHEQEHRWDYLLGHAPTEKIVGLEPHSAKNDQVSTVIAKRKQALDQLRGHLKPGVIVEKWYWVASGTVDFSPFEKEMVRLANHGITFIGRMLYEKHLPVVAERVGAVNRSDGKTRKKQAARSRAAKSR